MPENVLKWIAALSMLIDHAGLILFPDQEWMRAVGRLAFPLYAYCIAEGFRYTHSRLRYFLSLFLLGIVCQIVYAAAGNPPYIGILLVFSASILLLCVLDRAVHATGRERALFSILFAVLIAAAFVLCRRVPVDYGFCGILLPLFPYFFTEKYTRLAAFTLGLLCVCAVSLNGGDIRQLFSLAAPVLLLFYNEQPGKHRMKWFFYIFYPVHIAILEGISYLTA